MDVVVSITDEWLADVPAVVAALGDAGLVVTTVDEDLGVVAGSVDDHLVPTLWEVSGVSMVEPARHVQVPPPDAEIQ